MRVAVLTATGVGQPKHRTNALLPLHDRLAELPGVLAIHATHREDRTKPSLAPQIAAQIASADDVTAIYAIGHSAGGFFAVDVCWELDELGRTVDGLFLADAWRLRGAILIPRNVKKLWSYRQHNNRPRGSDIATDVAATEWVVDDRDLPIKHAEVDEYVVDQGILWKLVLAAVKG